MAVDLHPDVVRAIQRVSKTKLGKRFDRYSQKEFGMPGWKLAAKQTAGEFGGRSTATGRGVVSSAGARGPAQFISSTRDAYVKQYGIDPWKDDVSAIKGLMLHDLNTGVAGYNPGMPTYTNYVTSQKLNRADRRALRRGAGGGESATGSGPWGGGTLELPGRKRTEVTLGKQVIPGQSFEAERSAARRELLMGGELTLDRLLAYKSTVNSMRDVPERTVSTDLQVKRSQGDPMRVQTRGGGQGGGAAPRGRGQVVISPGANRPGVNMTPKVLGALDHLSAVSGEKVVVGTGTNHSQMTTSGNVSDHWSGNGADIPLSGAELTKRGRQALMAYGMSPAEARKAQGGIYNLTWKGKRVQVIFNTTEGGNHWNHLHIGVR